MPTLPATPFTRPEQFVSGTVALLAHRLFEMRTDDSFYEENRAFARLLTPSIDQLEAFFEAGGQLTPDAVTVYAAEWSDMMHTLSEKIIFRSNWTQDRVRVVEITDAVHSLFASIIGSDDVVTKHGYFSNLEREKDAPNAYPHTTAFFTSLILPLNDALRYPMEETFESWYATLDDDENDD